MSEPATAPAAVAPSEAIKAEIATIHNDPAHAFWNAASPEHQAAVDHMSGLYEKLYAPGADGQPSPEAKAVEDPALQAMTEAMSVPETYDLVLAEGLGDTENPHAVKSELSAAITPWLKEMGARQADMSGLILAHNEALRFAGPNQDAKLAGWQRQSEAYLQQRYGDQAEGRKAMLRFFVDDVCGAHVWPGLEKMGMANHPQFIATLDGMMARYLGEA